jgi:colanic acid biosynthesis glycosyl transferase WcaI
MNYGGGFHWFSLNGELIGVKIIIYSLNYAPEIIGIGKYNAELADWLTEHGHEVQVICAPPYYPRWKVESGYSAWMYRKELYNSISIWRCPLWIPRSPSGFKRILHLLSFAIFSLPVLVLCAFKWKPDVIFTLEPPFFCLPGTLLVSKLFKCNVWLHIQDFELDAGFNLGLIPNLKILRYITFEFERWLLQQASMVSTISQEMLKLLESKGVPSKQRVLFPNWVNTQEITPLDRTSLFRFELGLHLEQTVCLYSGNLGQKQGLDILIDAAFYLQHLPDIVFVIAGDGPMRTSLIKQATDLRSIRFLGLQSQERFNDLLNMADIHLLPQSGETSNLFFPSKLKAMFASGRPVITTANASTQLAQIVTGRGIVVPPDNAFQLSKAIQFLSQDIGLRGHLGNAARDYAVNHWSQEHVLNNVGQHLIKLVEENSVHEKVSPINPRFHTKK